MPTRDERNRELLAASLLASEAPLDILIERLCQSIAAALTSTVYVAMPGDDGAVRVAYVSVRGRRKETDNAPMPVGSRIDRVLRGGRPLMMSSIADWEGEAPVALGFRDHVPDETVSAQTIADLLREHDLDGSLIGLELTESSFINHERDLLATLNQIRALNVHLALDDFGVKYSSLEYLQRLPISTVKVDRVFVNDIVDNPFNASIVRAIVNVARTTSAFTSPPKASKRRANCRSSIRLDATPGRAFYSAARARRTRSTS
ncbi:MAG TPA: EAL domain-containing protein [Candidatus Baltobacteraceae bacterium]|nr:EAL domain-containing protein [Candidatus Baltobacteraceae bacterium]